MEQGKKRNKVTFV